MGGGTLESQLKADFANSMIERVAHLIATNYGPPIRVTKKVMAWNIRPDLGLVIEINTPRRNEAANLWLPNPSDGSEVPEIAFEYPEEAGRHSNTYPSPGLKKGSPALKIIVRSDQELEETLAYVNAMKDSKPLPAVKKHFVESEAAVAVDVRMMPAPKKVARRRESIPRSVQREVWQRDGGRCVECKTREFLCFDHIVPFSRGGSNTVRNLQLLCEKCNLSKGNRI